jgi:integrase
MSDLDRKNQSDSSLSPTRGTTTEDITRNNRCDYTKLTEAAASFKGEPMDQNLYDPYRHRRRRNPTWLEVVGITKEDMWHSKYPSVQRLLDHFCYHKSASEHSIKTYLGAYVSPLCKILGVTPDELVSYPREKVEKIVEDFSHACLEVSRQHGPSTGYAKVAVAALKTFFRVNGFDVENGTALRLTGYRSPRRGERNTPECIPTHEEAWKMAERARNKRDRAIIYVLASTGVRNTTLRAIIISDIRSELGTQKNSILLKIRSEWNERIPGACKNRIPYEVFLCRQAIKAVEEMLEERQRLYGSIDPEEPLFITKYNQIGLKARKRSPLSDRELQLIVQKCAEAAGIPDWKYVHPHCLRKTFEAVLRANLVDGSQMNYEDQLYLTGHVLPGSQDHYYDRNIDRLRTVYEKIVFDPQSKITADNVRNEIAQLYGIDFNQVKSEKEKQLGRKLTADETTLLFKEICSNQSSKTKKEQIVVEPELVEEKLSAGWTFVGSLHNGKVILTK